MMSPGIMILWEEQTAGSHVFQRDYFHANIPHYTKEEGKTGKGESGAAELKGSLFFLKKKMLSMQWLIHHGKGALLTLHTAPTIL